LRSRKKKLSCLKKGALTRTLTACKMKQKSMSRVKCRKVAKGKIKRREMVRRI
jgi:hypothetical protein